MGKEPLGHMHDQDNQIDWGTLHQRLIQPLSQLTNLWIVVNSWKWQNLGHAVPTQVGINLPKA